MIVSGALTGGMSSRNIGFGIVGTGMIAGVHAQAIVAGESARLVAARTEDSRAGKALRTRLAPNQ